MESILLIEDDIDTLSLVNNILSLANYNVKKTQDGKKALEILNNPENSFSLILCDIGIPEVDGYALLIAARNMPKYLYTPFIFISGRSDKADIRRGMVLGADDYLLKPFTPDELLSTVSAKLLKTKNARESQERFLAFEQILKNSPVAEGDLSNKNFTTRILQKRDVLFCQGDTAANIYYVVQGQFRISTVNTFGKEFISNIFSTGDFLAYNTLFYSGQYEGTAIAAEKSEVVILPKNDFLALLSTSKTTSALFIKFVCNLLAETESRLPKIVYGSARKRMADAIIYMSKKCSKKSNERISFPVTRDELSAVSGVTPETASRSITEFRVEKLIDFGRGELIVLDSKKLGDIRN